MYGSKRHPQFALDNQKILTVSIAAALTTMVPLAANATCMSLDGSGNADISLCTGNLTISSPLTGTLTNSGTLMAIGTTAAALQNASANSIGVIRNSGTLLSERRGLDNEGILNQLINTGSGTIYASSNRGQAIVNNGVITSLLNQGRLIIDSTTSNTDGAGGTALSANPMGIANYQAISTIDNSGTISISGGSATGIYSNGSVGTLSNSGRIEINGARGAAIDNSLGTITSLTNSGVLSAVGNTANGVFNTGTLSSLVNTGTITSSGTNSRGIYNGTTGTITSLNNRGTISGPTALYNRNVIGTLHNSGTISGANYAIRNDTIGSIGTVVNSGVIGGSIQNASTNNLSISGASGSTFGTLTGASGGIGAADIGHISNTASNLTFASGNQLLNDNINVTGHTAINAGAVLQVNNQLSIDGRYSQGVTGTLVIGVGNSAVANGVTADTGYGRLTVSGSAVIASGSSVTLKALGSYGFAVGQRYVVVQAATTNTNYNASSLLYSAIGYNGTVTGSAVIDGANTNLLLTLGAAGGGGNGGGSSSNAPNNAATTSNAVSAITGLYKYNGANISLLNVFNAAAALGSTAEANRAGARLSPSSNAMAATQASSAPTQSVLNVTASHVDGLRTAQADGGSGVSTGEYGPNNALWGQVFGGKASQGMRDNVSGYSADYNGLLIGGDRLVSDAWRVGGLFSYANTSVNNRDDNTGSSVSLKSYGLIGYAGYTANSWYLDLSGGVVRHKYSTTRLIDFTGFSGSANGSYNGTQSVLTAEGGYPIRLDDTTVLTPIAGLSYSKLNQSGYTETGGNGAALTVAANSSSSLKSSLGAKLERSYATSFGSLAPSVQLAWRHEYHDTRLMSVASFAADTSGATTFTTFGAKPVTDTGVMALAATLTRSNNMTLTARYTLEAGGGYKAQTADLRLRYQF